MDWGLIGVILAIVFGVATIILSIVAIRQARRKKPVWAYATKKLIGLGTNAPPELKLTFNDEPINNVFRTVFIFFNRGNEAIRKSDVTRSVTVRFSGATILRQSDVRPSKDDLGLVTKRIISGQDSVIELDFPYLDHNDGAVLEVLHTEYKGIECIGNILEAGKPHYIGEFVPYRPKYATRRFGIVAVDVAFVLMILIGWVVTVFQSSKPDIAGHVFFALILLAIGSQTVRDSLSFFSYLKFPKWSTLQGRA